MYQRLLLVWALGLLLIALVSVGARAADKCSPSATAEGAFSFLSSLSGSAPWRLFGQIFAPAAPFQARLGSISDSLDLKEAICRGLCPFKDPCADEFDLFAWLDFFGPTLIDFLAFVRVGFWEWRDGTTVAYPPNSFATNINGTAFDPAAPSPRHSSSTWISTNDTVYLFGGLGAPSYSSTDPLTARAPSNAVDGMHSDMWRYAIRTKTWTLVSGLDTLKSNLPGRYSAVKRSAEATSRAESLSEAYGEATTASDSSFVAKAGDAHEDPSSSAQRQRLLARIAEDSADQEIATLEAIKRISLLDVRPGARINAGTWTSPVDGSLWMFGGLGYGQNGSAYGYLNDMWQFDTEALQWAYRGGSLTNGAPDSSFWPGGRTGAITWTSPGTLWLFGGYGPYEVTADNMAERLRNDIWSFDLATSTWTLVGGNSFYATSAQTSNYYMTPRTDAIAWPDSDDGLIWIFGGYGTLTTDATSAAGYLNDLWAWNSSAQTWTTVSPANSLNAPGFIAESSGVSSPNNRPPARCCSATWTDTYGRLYFFAGFGMSSIANQPSSTPDFVEDMWVLETATYFRDRAWTWVSGGVSKPAPAVVWAASTVDPGSPGETPVATNAPAPASKTRSLVQQDRLHNVTMTAAAPFRQQRYRAVERASSTPSPGTPATPPSSSPPNPLVSPGSRAWMTCWYSSSTNQAYIFGSIGVNPRVSTSTLPAYFQDLWAFVLPARPATPTLVPSLSNGRVSAIVWGIVGAEAFLIAILLAVYFIYTRRRRSKDLEQDSEDSSTNSTNTSEMALLPPQSHYYNGLEGGYLSATTAYDQSGSYHPRGTPTSSPVPSPYSSQHSSQYAAPGDGPPGTKYFASSSSATSSNPSNSSIASYESANSQTKKSRRSQSLHLANGSNVRKTAPHRAKVAGVPHITASFDLIIKKSELEFGSIIGRGSSGTIYAGRWHDQRVAIKQLETEAILGGREGALEEAKLVSLIRPHPNVIQIFGVCVTKVHVFIVMSKMHSSLDKLIYHVQRRKWLTQHRMYKMAMGIVAGMLHLEAQGICHRDLAARNVCLSKTGNPCITDFGMSRKLNFSASLAVGETLNQMGPVAWMAPECFLQKYSSKSDVWSFGIVLYEMMAGTVPHRGVDLHQLAAAIRDEGVTPGPIPAEADRGLVEIMKSCWARDPADRPTFAQISKRLHELSNADESDSDSGQSKESSAAAKAKQKTVQHEQDPPKIEAGFGRSNRTSIDTSRYPAANVALLRRPIPQKPRKEDKASTRPNGGANGSGVLSSSARSNRLPAMKETSSSTPSTHSSPSPTHSISSVSSSTTISSSSVMNDSSSTSSPSPAPPSEPNGADLTSKPPPKPLGSGDYVNGF